MLTGPKCWLGSMYILSGGKGPYQYSYETLCPGKQTDHYRAASGMPF